MDDDDGDDDYDGHADNDDGDDHKFFIRRGAELAQIKASSNNIFRNLTKFETTRNRS